MSSVNNSFSKTNSKEMPPEVVEQIIKDLEEVKEKVKELYQSYFSNNLPSGNLNNSNGPSIHNKIFLESILKSRLILNDQVIKDLEKIENALSEYLPPLENGDFLED